MMSAWPVAMLSALSCFLLPAKDNTALAILVNKSVSSYTKLVRCTPLYWLRSCQHSAMDLGEFYSHLASLA